jgi:uncharacterized protein (DUF4415 family)
MNEPVKKRTRGPGKKPRKSHVSLRIDAEVYKWLEETYPNPYNGIKAILHKQMTMDKLYKNEAEEQEDTELHP